MKSAFIRTLWGFYNDERPLYRCRKNMDYDIALMKMSKYESQIDSTTYVFGEDNYKQLSDMGLKCVMVDKNPMVWQGDEMFRHKLEVLKLVAEEYDRFVFLDLDCILVKDLPSNFWEKSEEKMPIQASLMWYVRRKMKFCRKIDQGLNPCACYVYIRDKKIPNELIRTWEEIGKSSSEEMAIAKYMDDLMGGWQGKDRYYELFEPHFFSVSERVVYTQPKPDPQCFFHFHEARTVDRILEGVKRGEKLEWMI